jgi:D-mannonate dehydratase
MLDIGIFAPFGDDHDRNVAFCQDTDVHHIVVSSSSVAADEASGAPDTEALKQLAGKYTDSGIQLAALTPPRISQVAFTDLEVREKELNYMRSLLAAMGAAGIPYVHLYLNVDSIDEEKEDRDQLWAGLVEVYRAFMPAAEAAGVQISTHHYHRADRLLWNYQTMSTLISEVGSGNNGVTYCQGKSQMAGDNLVDDILNYGNQIFMFHIRDVVTQVEGEPAPEVAERLARMGYLEVAFGTGEIDMVGSFKALKQINYKGQLYPEHFPSIAGDHAAGLAWTIGYMRAMDAAVEV